MNFINIHRCNPFSYFFVNQVRKLLADDPGNSEYADMEKELEEVRVYLNLLVGYSSNIVVTV